MGNNCCPDNEYDEPSSNPNKSVYRVDDLQPAYYSNAYNAPAGDYGYQAYTPRAYPLEKDDEQLQPLQISYPDRPPYMII
jgi:hypothetical protein